jgi:bacillithiol biosynthesis cysteine-adding enzyme BshC
VKSQCLPFSQIPHTTRLFADFLSYLPAVRQFYPHSPRFGDWFKDELSNLNYDASRREQVAAILERQNRSFDASPKTMENIARLRAGAAAVVTGQQVGLFGGPQFSVFKALTAVKLAAEASAGGVDCVPVFWLATQDHDLEEVNHAMIPRADASLQTFTVPTHDVVEAPVGAITFGAEIEPVVAAAAELLGDSEVTQFLRDSYRPGETFGSAFARLFARLFADWGVILLDAADPALNKIARPIYRAAIKSVIELNKRLIARGNELEAAGYHQQVKVTPVSTLLFALRNGSRLLIHQEARGLGAPEFRIGEESVSQAELLRRIDSQPENFSANVLLRPVVQDYLLPTIAYTGGAAEIAYFAQAAVIYEALADRVTPVVPRFSASLIEHKPQLLLERYGVSLVEVFRGPEPLREMLAARSLSQELQRTFDEANASVEKSLENIRTKLADLDKTLIDSATHAEEKMKYQLAQLRSRAARAELRQTEILGRRADFLSNTLYPNKVLQEREVPGIYFLANHGLQLLPGLYDMIRSECLEHQAITLD